jgi:hypothetical protein
MRDDRREEEEGAAATADITVIGYSRHGPDGSATAASRPRIPEYGGGSWPTIADDRLSANPLKKTKQKNAEIIVKNRHLSSEPGLTH